MITTPIPPDDQSDFRPGRLVSLQTMINYQLLGLFGWLTLVEQEKRISKEKCDALLAVAQMQQPESNEVPQETYLMTEQDKSRLENMLTYANDMLCEQLELTGTRNRIARFRIALRSVPLSPVTVANELKTLLEAIDDDAKFKYFYYYHEKMVKPLLQVDKDWELAFKSFPSCKSDAIEATDNHALCHYNSTVYCCIRVLERGLCLLAKDVDIPFSAQEWNKIINDIEGKIQGMQRNGIAGLDKTQKDARLQFLSGAAAEFRYFKDAWRNYAAHVKVDYDQYEAERVLEHTRSFMNHLASQLSEQP